MPQSLAAIYIHLIFSTKDRHPYITEDARKELHPYLAEICNQIGCPATKVGGVEDHVHILFRLSRTTSLAAVIQEIKTSSSKWIKAKWNYTKDFTWQGGYAAYSISATDIGDVVRYIESQVEHHKKVTFQDEVRKVLNEAGIEFDEQYLWD
ncbi:MAG TPA: IS200/IS605 family transposase [Fimbriimonadaceae bacterium]|nr:IS200/IS605 family transposase [Fimbriimonadaceae bacterium]